MGNKTKTENEESNLRHNVPLKSVKEDFVSSTMFLRIVTAIKNTFVENFFLFYQFSSFLVPYCVGNIVVY